MVFVREYQDYSGMSEVERALFSEQALFSEHLMPHATARINYLDKVRSKNEILPFRTSVRIEGAEIESESTASPKKSNERNQFAFFLDLAHFERAGKAYGEHCKLRSTTLKLYGPGGELEKASALHLVVELCILKAADLEAEYVGCVEGTGLMFLEEMVCPKPSESAA